MLSVEICDRGREMLNELTQSVVEDRNDMSSSGLDVEAKGKCTAVEYVNEKRVFGPLKRKTYTTFPS